MTTSWVDTIIQYGQRLYSRVLEQEIYEINSYNLTNSGTHELDVSIYETGSSRFTVAKASQGDKSWRRLSLINVIFMTEAQVSKCTEDQLQQLSVHFSALRSFKLTTPEEREVNKLLVKIKSAQEKWEKERRIQEEKERIRRQI